MNIQYSLPPSCRISDRADRTLEGARKCILHAVWNAQGKGCSPGAIGVCIGGDRTSGYLHAKEQLFRTLDDVNPDARLADLEATSWAPSIRLASARWVSGETQPDRLQDRSAQSAAGKFLRVGGLRLLGVSQARRPP